MLYNVIEKRFYDLQIIVPTPYTTIKIIGSAHGWFIMVSADTFSLTLFNSFSGESIDLPPINRKLVVRHSLLFVLKGVLSTNPIVNPNNYVIMILGEKYSSSRPNIHQNM